MIANEMLHNLATLAIDDLPREFTAIEKRGWFEDNPAIWPLDAARRYLSAETWAAFGLVATLFYGLPTAPVLLEGAAIGHFGHDHARALADIVAESPLTSLRLDDFDCGAMSTTQRAPIDSLNDSNAYRVVTPKMLAGLHQLLFALAPEIEAACGHCWTVGSVHCFELRTGKSGAVHLDGWPRSIKKLFLMPHGVGKARGSTYLKLHSGKEIVPESDEPAWIIFENSTVPHAAIGPEIGTRLTIEIDLIPTLSTDPSPRYVGINGWYPWFPGADKNTAIYRDGLKRSLDLVARCISAGLLADEATAFLDYHATQSAFASLCRRQTIAEPAEPPKGRTGFLRMLDSRAVK